MGGKRRKKEARKRKRNENEKETSAFIVNIVPSELPRRKGPISNQQKKKPKKNTKTDS